MSLRYGHEMPFGATLLEGDRGVRFALCAPGNDAVSLVYVVAGEERRVALERRGMWFEATCADAAAGTRYRFDIGGLVVPDPASRYQPDGVHGASLVVDPLAFDWPDDGWRGLHWNEHVFYELHVGAFTPEGTYAAAQTKLGELAELGVTAIELMPVADVPGSRNWGYDGVLPFAPSHNYGTPGDLKRFVVACHAHGLAVYLDVVYNHFGPEGNYLHAYAKPFYTDRFHTPWGAAIDVTDDDAPARAFFVENARYWLHEFRFDGLRLDAVHEIYDRPARPFLRDLAKRVAESIDRPVNLILENDANEAALLGAGYRAQWNDDAHHAAHAAITGQRDGYYADYATAAPAMLARTLTSGFAYQGEPSTFRGGAVRGEPSLGLELASFVTFLQNHDQVGNRPFGDRITALAPPEAVRAAVAILLLAPSTPLLFMGEEWAASTPFLFFCDFEPELAVKVTQGRRNEFRSLAEFSDPIARERIPDPAAEQTFLASKLRWDERAQPPHGEWLEYYRHLLHLRRSQISPRVAGLRGTAAGFETVGASGFRARWDLPAGEVLALDANLSASPLDGFGGRAGRVLFSTHPETFDRAHAPAWSVRWTLA